MESKENYLPSYPYLRNIQKYEYNLKNVNFQRNKILVRNEIAEADIMKDKLKDNLEEETKNKLDYEIRNLQRKKEAEMQLTEKRLKHNYQFCDSFANLCLVLIKCLDKDNVNLLQLQNNSINDLANLYMSTVQLSTPLDIQLNIQSNTSLDIQLSTQLNTQSNTSLSTQSNIPEKIEILCNLSVTECERFKNVTQDTLDNQLIDNEHVQHKTEMIIGQMVIEDIFENISERTSKSLFTSIYSLDLIQSPEEQLKLIQKLILSSDQNFIIYIPSKLTEQGTEISSESKKNTKLSSKVLQPYKSFRKVTIVSGYLIISDKKFDTTIFLINIYKINNITIKKYSETLCLEFNLMSSIKENYTFKYICGHELYFGCFSDYNNCKEIK
jgi:hypothetical protein